MTKEKTEEWVKEFNKRFTKENEGISFRTSCHTSPTYVKLFIKRLLSCNSDCETHCQELGIAKGMIENLEEQVKSLNAQIWMGRAQGEELEVEEVKQCLLKADLVFHKQPAVDDEFYEWVAFLAEKVSSQFKKPALDEAVSLIDGCKSIIEIFKPISPAQEEWKRDWLIKARAMIDQQGKK